MSTSCASPRDLYRVERYFWKNRRGQNLCVYTYKCKNPVAAVFFHHGFCEYCGWWKRMFTVLAEAGIDVYAYDMHGHGLSEPQHEEGRVCIVSADHLVEDAEEFLDGVVEPALRGASGEDHPCGTVRAAPPDERRNADISGDGSAHGGCNGATADRIADAAAEMATAAAVEVAADVGEAVGVAAGAISDAAHFTAATLPGLHELDDRGVADAAEMPEHENERCGTQGEERGEDSCGTSCGDATATKVSGGHGERRVKLFGVAHSLGGGVLSLLEAKRPGTFAGLALNAPALGRQLSFLDNVAMVIVGALRSLCPTAQLIPSTPWPLLSDDDEVPRRANGDAAYFNGACRIVTAYSIATLFQRLNAAAGSVQCPLYVQWASEEKITCRAAAEAFVAAMSDHEVTWDEICDARHVMIHGRRGPVLVRSIRDWLLQKVSACAAAAAAAAATVAGATADGKLSWPEAPFGCDVSGEIEAHGCPDECVVSGGDAKGTLSSATLADGDKAVAGSLAAAVAVHSQLLTVESAPYSSDVNSDSGGSSGRVAVADC